MSIESLIVRMVVSAILLVAAIFLLRSYYKKHHLQKEQKAKIRVTNIKLALELVKILCSTTSVREYFASLLSAIAFATGVGALIEFHYPDFTSHWYNYIILVLIGFAGYAIYIGTIAMYFKNKNTRI